MSLDEEEALTARLEHSLSQAVNDVMDQTPLPQRPLTSLIEALKSIDAADLDGDGMVSEEERLRAAQHEADALKEEGLSKSDLGLVVTHFAAKFKRAADADDATPASKAKKVLFVIDCQDGYDGEFVGSLPHDVPGGLDWIQQLHEVQASYELVSKQKITDFGRGEKLLRFDKVWNRGLDGAAFAKVCERVVTELQSKAYDLVVFTYDYLERSDGEEKGVFALDATPWSDPAKPVALVSYGQYLTINAGGLGTNVSRRIRKALPEVTHTRGAEGNEVCGVPALYFRKQVDDAFDDAFETSERTLNQPWLDNVDVDDIGLPKPKAETLLAKLKRLGFGPDEAEASFCGVVTNRCVASSLLHSVQHGYSCKLLEGGCMAASDQEHVDGVAMIRDKGGAAVEVVP